MNNNGDDDLDDDIYSPGPDSPPWFQKPAPSVRVTFTIAAIVLVYVAWQHHQRVLQLRVKFSAGQGSNFRGALRYSAIISAYVDNDDPTFAIARLVGKSTVFLGLMQLNFIHGFLLMLFLLILESSLDTIRILLAYYSCQSLRQLRATTASSDEAKDLGGDDDAKEEDETLLEPTNLYEDLARPMPISIMVFSVQTLLIGCVMYDTYSTTTRTCFNGVATDTCPMLASMGSYCLYYLGTFMACVFYVGPLNSYGKKEHDPVFWLKLFVLSKRPMAGDGRNRVLLSWPHPVLSNKTMTMQLRRNDVRIWTRFFMSLLINSVCFHFLLNVLPVQIASKSSIMGIVFSSVGMIYLVDLDDTSGQPLTVVAGGGTTESSSRDVGGGGARNGYDSLLPAEDTTTTATTTDNDNNNLDAVKQRLIEQALQEIRAKLEAELGVVGTNHRPSLLAGKSSSSGSSSGKIEGITHALFLSTNNTALVRQSDDEGATGEKTPLIV
jgi:hypothetical protein